MLEIWRLKFSWSSIWTSNSFTEDEGFIILSLIFKVSLVWHFFFLSIIIAWNLPGLTIILLFWNHSMVVLLSVSKSAIKILNSFLEHSWGVVKEKESHCNYMDDCVSKKIVGHVFLNWSKVASKFFQFTNHHICVEVTGKRVSPLCWIGTRNTSKLFFVEMQESWHGWKIASNN